MWRTRLLLSRMKKMPLRWSMHACEGSAIMGVRSEGGVRIF